MTIASLWDWLKAASERADQELLGLWDWLQQRLDPAQYAPEAAEGVVARQLTGRAGKYYVLKNPTPKTYYRLSDRDFFLWERMDGTQTVKDLVVAYFTQFGSFAFARVVSLVEGLKASLFLTDQPVNIYQQLRERLAARSLSYRLNQMAEIFVEKQFAVSGIDGALGAVYRTVGWILYTTPMQTLYMLITISGLYFFFRAFRTGEFGVVTIGGSYAWGIIGLLVAELASILVHEMSHALTVKHYGREVRRGGVMLYFGTPAFFVDTTDIWLENKWARLAVTWAGPYSGLILGGLASAAITLWPKWELSGLLFQFALVSYVLVFFNLNPLLELDGYFVLMDALEIPMLRVKSLDFARSGLWAKLKKLLSSGQTVRKMLASFSREEEIFAAFGLLSAVWTIYAIYSALNFWSLQLAGILSSLWRAGGVGQIVVDLLGVVIAVPLIVSIGGMLLRIGRQGLDWAAGRRLFDRAWNVAAIMLLLTVALALGSGYFGHPAPPTSGAAGAVISLAALAVAAFLAWQNAANYAGSRLARPFRLLGLFLLALLLKEAATTAVTWQLLSAEVPQLPLLALGLLAYSALLLAGLALFANTDLKELQPVEKALLALGLAVTCWVTVFIAQHARHELLVYLSGMLLPLLALTLLVPTMFSFWRTGSGPAWALFLLALGTLVAVNWLGQSPLVPSLLFASSLFIHRLAYTRTRYRVEGVETAIEMRDQLRLQRAFGWTVSGVLAQFSETAGERNSRVLKERFNRYALATGGKLNWIHDRMSDALPADLGAIERGQVYAAALNVLLDQVAQEVGQKLTVRALQRVYDRLPWEEREIGAQYLFRDVERAAALSRQFQATRRDYSGLLQRMPLFTTMDPGELQLLCSCLREEHFPAGKAIVRQGDRGDKFYVIRQGHVKVTIRDEQGVMEIVNQLDRGNYFGELALLRDAPRSATCHAIVPTDVLSLSRQDFDRLVKARFALREKVDACIARVDLLRRMPLFAELESQQVQLVAATMKEDAYETGQVIIRQGEIGDTFYVIQSGRVQVTVEQAGEQEVLAERGPGEYLGEIALLLEVPRTATVTALTPVHALTLHKQDFDQLVAKYLYVSRGLERETSRRMINLRRMATAQE
jgi:putative peptide zinc metalloprotease protein